MRRRKRFKQLNPTVDVNYGLLKSGTADSRRVLVVTGPAGNIYYREGDSPPQALAPSRAQLAQVPHGFRPLVDSMGGHKPMEPPSRPLPGLDGPVLVGAIFLAAIGVVFYFWGKTILLVGGIVMGFTLLTRAPGVALAIVVLVLLSLTH